MGVPAKSSVMRRFPPPGGTGPGITPCVALKFRAVSEGATAVLVPIVLVVLGIIIAFVMGKGR